SLVRGAKASALGVGHVQILGMATGLGVGRITLGAVRVMQVSGLANGGRARRISLGAGCARDMLGARL
ncbi:hypothetical protein A2U01_0098209, partial [Trifolium medium]|nr:hypothetical protein [Trifolium medium]